ncbi:MULTISPECIES: thiamine pyrophosphate-binding protein [unclassified Mesorhizobium]|uniref:thiamine pyrophosphate-binding protein n=1 Tax=unclassified Mesorhizobium TaxID=325217 RepID=UPI0033353242
MARMEAAEALVDVLDREGVRHVFGVPGGPVLGLCDAISRHPRISLVLTKHEQAAAYAAFGSALATGQMGVCLATLGPGATNLLAGLPVARVEAVPVLAITGQVQLSGMARGAHQDASGWYGTPDQKAMFGGTCKQTELCTLASSLPDLARRAIRAATSDRQGPVHVSIPSGLLHETIDYSPLDPKQYRLMENCAVDKGAAARVARALSEAKAPAILLGGRAMRPACGPAVRALADAFGIALCADLASKSVVDEHHSNYLGCIGVLGHKAAENFLKKTADLILSVGQSFDEISTLGWDPAFAERRSLIQLDSIGEEIGKAFPVSDASVGHLPALLEAICEAHPTLSQERLVGRQQRLAEELRRNPTFSSVEMVSDKVPMLPQRVMADLTAAVPEDAVVLSDSSKWARWLGRFFRAREGQIFSAHDYEPMGWAVAAALGVQAARPDTPVICLSGDGAFLMAALEVSTAVDHSLPIVWMVMNDGRLGIIHDLQRTLFGGRVCGTTFNTPNLPAFAQSLGADGAVVESPGALVSALSAAITAKRPTILDIRFDVEEIPALRPRSLLVTKGMGLPNPTPGPETIRTLFKLMKER